MNPRKFSSSKFMMLVYFVLFVFAANAFIGWLTHNPPYYRLRVSFESRGQTGELEVVVRCKYYVRKPLGGTRSNEYYPTPELFGTRLHDNSMVLVRAGGADVCSNAYVARRKKLEFNYTGTPRLIWVNDFDKQDQAEIYFGERSYRQPGALVSYSEARITAASFWDYWLWIIKVRPLSLLGMERVNSDYFVSGYDHYFASGYDLVNKKGKSVFDSRIEANICLVHFRYPDQALDELENLKRWIAETSPKDPTVIPTDDNLLGDSLWKYISFKFKNIAHYSLRTPFGGDFHRGVLIPDYPEGAEEVIARGDPVVVHNGQLIR